MTYRIGAHSTADDDGRYRAREEVERGRSLDPIARYRRWLLATGHADDGFVRTCEDEAETWVGEVRSALTATPPPPADWMFDWVFADPPATLSRQREEALGG
jgi:TPP-dependent pyruvate/acetoin dehydrogenase alpha subunit